jgi:hypothetical protein
VGIFLLLILANCSGMPAREDNYSTDSITIHNIPLTVNGQAAYKAYVYVSDSMSQYVPHKAQGTALLNGADSISVQLYEPPEVYRGKDPDDHGAAWSGTGGYFSVIISPRTVSGAESILVRGGQALNKPNRVCDFVHLVKISGSSILSGKAEAVYNEIIRADRQGIGTDIEGP